MDRKQLEEVARKLIEQNKGILAIDESPTSMEKKFKQVGIQNTEENRRRYREMLLTTPKDLSKYIGGVILNEETFHQFSSADKSFVEIIRENKILPGVKLDKGLLPLREGSDEKLSTGLEDLGERCKEYRNKGAMFAKWRSVFSIENNLPTEECIYKNCDILSEYAHVCQSNGVVPVVEPEVLFDGSYGLRECQIVTSSVISCLFYHLNRKGVHIPGTLLKVGFITSGSKNTRESLEEVAKATIETFMSSVPPGLPGVVFLSGGHPEDRSVEYLKEVNRTKKQMGAPWSISYSFGRALQDSALALWNNEDAKKEEAQKHLINRALLCSRAVQGESG